MKNNDNLLMLLVSEVKQMLKENEMESAVTCHHQLIEKLKFAMRLVKNHWLVTDPDTQFRGAIGGTMIYYGKESEEFKRMEWELQQLRRLEITIKAAQEGLSTTFNDIPDNQFTPIGLLKLWREIK